MSNQEKGLCRTRDFMDLNEIRHERTGSSRDKGVSKHKRSVIIVLWNVLLGKRTFRNCSLFNHDFIALIMKLPSQQLDDDKSARQQTVRTGCKCLNSTPTRNQTPPPLRSTVLMFYIQMMLERDSRRPQVDYFVAQLDVA